MITRVQISPEDMEQVELLHTRFMGYCNILGYLTQYGSLDTNLFDKKWEEAIEIDRRLQELKVQMDLKYHPQDDREYSHYSFDFLNKLMVYEE